MDTVLVAQPAYRDLQEQRDWWAEHRSVEQAARWYAGFSRALLKLEKNPEQLIRALEDGLWPFAVRQLTYRLGRKPTRRALFAVHVDNVVILRIRHLAQELLSADDI